MPLDVTLGTSTWRWQLKDDQIVEEWLSRRPWCEGGGVLVVQAPDDEDATPRALRRGIFAADARVSDVRVVPLLGDGASSIVHALGAWLNVPVERERDLVLALGEDLQVRPAVFVLDCRSSADGAWAEQATLLLDWASKLEVVRRPTFVVIHGRGQASLRGKYVLDRGWPVGLARALLDGQDEDVWAKYLHLRFAWEAGGVVDDGSDCASIAAAVPLSNDEELERVLNVFAAAKFELMPREERDGWVAFVGEGRATTRPTVFGAVEDSNGRLTPLPWLARALLLRSAARGSRLRALRTEVTCRPLSEQVLNRCFAVEASLRGRLPEALPEPPAELQKAYELFAAAARGRSSLGYLNAELYPSSHPCPPRDAWDFASVGTVVKCLRTSRSTEWQLLRRVSELRNAVAHCHYIGWRGLQEARAIGKLLSPIGP